MPIGTRPHFSQLPLTNHLRPINTMLEPIHLHSLSHLPQPTLYASNQLEVRRSNILPPIDLFQMPPQYSLFYPVFPQPYYTLHHRYAASSLPKKRTLFTGYAKEQVGIYHIYETDVTWQGHPKALPKTHSFLLASQWLFTPIEILLPW